MSLRLVLLVATACTTRVTTTVTASPSEVMININGTPTPVAQVGGLATPSVLPDTHGVVVKLQLMPIPEGPPAPIFELNAPAGDDFVRPLKEVRRWIPVPFPAPLEQPADCTTGGNLVVTFADGSQLTYGPCKRPPSIDKLWAAMAPPPGR